MTLDLYADLFDDDLEAVAQRLDILREAARVARSLHDAPAVDSHRGLKPPKPPNEGP
ncbi:MAG: hypothetical protein QOG07_2120 [Pseudonocardiales bacterium]|nr:hypothetical protein [Pseudonocardiales bacterium]